MRSEWEFNSEIKNKKMNVVLNKKYEDYRNKNTSIRPVVKTVRKEAEIVERIPDVFEASYLAPLIQKYGDDYKAMERDFSLNIYQHTEEELHSLCMAYSK